MARKLGGGKSGQAGINTGKGRRILVIEDDPLSLELYDDLLQSVGYATLLATNGEEAVALARSTRPDLVLCDIRLPDMGGVEVMKQFKAEPALRQIPIIAATIFSSAGRCEHLVEAGFDGYIAKPIIAEVFIQQIESFINLEPFVCP
jgi:two-component system cell cycle response regulator